MGPDRAARMSPARSAGARDIPYTVHADTPVVPMEPMRMIWSTVNRISTSGAVIGGNQTVSPLEVLTVDPLTIDDIVVEKTILGGKVVYEVDRVNVQ